jgi:purine-binding chemotaxis protein CheW
MPASGGTSGQRRLLICRVGAKLCGLPLTRVLETLRPLRSEPLAGAPEFVSGVALIRGRPTPVIDARRLLGSASDTAPTRYVTLGFGADAQASRVAALAVDAVLGVRDLDEAQLAQVPSLLQSERELVSALGALDAELLVVLEHARLLPESLWQQLEQDRAFA